PIAAARKAEFGDYARTPVPGRFRVHGSPYLSEELVEAPAAAMPAATAEGALRGLGCCPGRVEAPVRIVLDPREEPLLNGEILCTVRTDPGWAPLFPTVGGLIVERGSTLSHSAVIAREFGIPTVVATPGVTRLLGDGDLVRLDGGAGTVEPVSPAAAPGDP